MRSEVSREARPAPDVSYVLLPENRFDSPGSTAFINEGEIVDFQLNDEQVQLKKMVRDFAQSEIAPNVMKWDEASEFPHGDG